MKAEPMPSLMQQIASKTTLLKAFHWVCQRREDYHHNHDIWHMRFHWPSILPSLRQALLERNYRFSPCRALSTSAGSIGVWDAQDALVLKAMSLVLTEHLAPHLSEDCYHLKGRGGSKGCVSKVEAAANQYAYVCRSDVNSYYATIDHAVLLKQLNDVLDEPEVITLVAHMLARLDDVGGDLYAVDIGLNKGNPLSPLLGALYLNQMDRVLGGYCRQFKLRYYRFMDDWVILCKTRHQLRTVVRLMNQQLDLVKQTKHPYKTYIGKMKEGGFDFLGYQIIPATHNKLTLAWKTWANHLGKLQQLYEQNTPVPRIAEYVKRWLIWVRSGVTIELNKVIQQGLNSEFAKSMDSDGLLAEMYWRVIGETGWD